MYLDFYDLEKDPFDMTPDPAFLFLSSSHREALASIIYGVEKRKGFILITGEVGTGKTSILRSYLDGVDKNKLRVVYIFYPNISFPKLLKTIFGELGLNAPSEDAFELVFRLREFMISEYNKGRNFVLVIDEAHNMPIETLEDLRMLSNLETQTDKLIQIVLAGPPELEKILNKEWMRQISQRVAVHATISPLTVKETTAYIRHRLEKVASGKKPVFTERAIKLIARRAKGIPRKINVICDNALITGFGYQKNPVDVKVVKEVITDLEGKKISRPQIMKPAIVVAILLAIVIANFVLLARYKNIFATDRVIENVQTATSSAIKEIIQTELSEHVKPPDVLNKDAGLQNQIIVVNTDEKPRLEISEAQPPLNEAKKAIVETKAVPSEFEKIHPEQTGESVERFPVTRTVKKSDNLYRLTLEVYGHTDSEIMQFVKKHNPVIEDIQNIPLGARIIFPKLNKTLRKAVDG